MDRPISEKSRLKNRNKSIFKISGGVILLAILFFGFRALLTHEVDKSKLRIATVKRSYIESSILASGSVEPLYEIVLNAPIQAEIEKIRGKIGTKVSKGDTLLELDAKFIQLQYEQLKDQLDLKKNNVSLLKLQYRKELNDLGIDFNMKELQMNRLISSLNDSKKLEAIGGATNEEVNQAELNVKIAKLEVKKLKEELNYKKDALSGNLKNLELEVRIQEKKLAELAEKISLSTIRPLQPGVITWINQSLGRKVNEGDELVRVANLQHFKVDAQITDRHLSKLRTGMPLKVRINKQFLKGSIAAILPEIKQNRVAFDIALENDSSSLLRPSMQLEVIVPTERKDDALVVANGAAFKGANHQEIFVVREGIAYKTKVKIGLTNGKKVELIGDVKEGDQIIVSSTNDFDHLSSFKLK